MKTVILTSDKHMWLLRGFFYMWKKYGGGRVESSLGKVEVAGFTPPEKGLLPDGIPFISLGSFENFPVNKWSDGLITYLNGISDDLVMILLEDYWMMRPINISALMLANEFMKIHRDVVRFDVAADRMFSKSAKYVGHFGEIDLCEAKEDYSISFQASIYRRKLLLDFMKPGESPWEAELYGSHRLNRSSCQVVGTYQWPVNYMIVVNKGQLDRTGSWMFPSRTLSGLEWRELDNLGYLEPEA